MEFVTLNNKVKMPILGFGVYQIPNPEECEKAVLDAICTGYRLIDTAASYGNEEAVGRAIEKSGVPREDLFITTKLWLSETGYDKTMKAFETSLKKLNLDYLDLYLIHQPFGDVYGSWRAMEDLYKQGVIRSIGVSNFYPDRLIDLTLNNEITPAINQVEVNPFCQRAKDQEIMKNKDIQMESWAPFAEGRNNLFQNEVLKTIGSKYRKSIAQVILRWLIQRGVVCIPKTVSKERMTENFNVFDFKLTQEDMDLITTLDTGNSMFFSHQDPAIVEMLLSLKR